jgi:hypothetical protein
MGWYEDIVNALTPGIAPHPAELINPDWLAASIPGSGLTHQPPPVKLQPGEVIISGQFAGTPVVMGSKTITGSPASAYVNGNNQMPTWWVNGKGAPNTPGDLAQAVAPYNAGLANQIRQTGDSANLAGQASSWLTNETDKIILVGGAALLVYALAK